MPVRHASPAVRRARSILSCAVLLALTLTLPASAQQAAPTRNPQVTANRGMVASAHALASQAGLEMLKAGGNAVDAAVAAAFAIGVVEPNATGIGGEGMMVIYLEKKKTAVAIDYRSAAPATATFPKGIPATGHAAVAIPGTVAGLTTALQKYGTMKLPRVMAPAIKLAEDGFVISPTLAGVIVDNFEEVAKNEPLAKIVCPTGLPLEAGGVLKNPDLAASLRKIAAGGADVFYRGELAEAITAEMAAGGGFITKADLASYRAVERTPVRGRYRGYEILSAPPPVGGVTVVETLQILDQLDLAKHAPLSPGYIHVVAEALKRGFADYSAFVADPDFVTVPVAGLLSKPYARIRAAEIDPGRITGKVSAGEPAKFGSPSTTHLSTVDRWGNMVALTQTLSDFFGAKVVISGTGITLNNEMKNFSARGVNAMAPGKRMRTTISPTILVQNGRAFATLGTPGAARIISTMTLLVSNLIDYKMGIQEAIEAPRFYARDTDKDLYVESRIPADTIAALTKLGYSIKTQGEFDLFFGGAQGIIIDLKTGKRIGGADPRRDGAVVGY
ncbi:MAG: gamma-glutamyltransferase [Planctomycetes bacterium]|nr:gamma-glutamyltransferase [Planctomycetota bacterium]